MKKQYPADVIETMQCPGCQKTIHPQPMYYFGRLSETVCPDCYTQCQDFRRPSWVIPILFLLSLWLILLFF